MTLLAERVTAPATVQPGHRGRRRIRRLLPAVVLALALAWVLLPQMIRLGEEVDPRLPVDAGLLVPEYGDDGAYFLHYRYGETVTVEVPVTNRSPVPITVEEVSSTRERLPLLEPASVEGLPVTLSPREGTRVAVTLRYANCRYYHERSTETLAGVEVHGTSLGRDFTETVAFARPITVHGQVILDCPERTLVRGDDVRR